MAENIVAEEKIEPVKPWRLAPGVKWTKEMRREWTGDSYGWCPYSSKIVKAGSSEEVAGLIREAGDFWSNFRGLRPLLTERVYKDYGEKPKEWNYVVDGWAKNCEPGKKYIVEMLPAIKAYGNAIGGNKKLVAQALKELGKFHAKTVFSMALLSEVKSVSGTEAYNIAGKAGWKEQVEMLGNVKWPVGEIQKYMDLLWTNAWEPGDMAIAGRVCMFALQKSGWLSEGVRESFSKWLQFNTRRTGHDGYMMHLQRSSMVRDWPLETEAEKTEAYKIIRENSEMLPRFVQNKNLGPLWIEKILKENPSPSIRKAVSARKDCLKEAGIRQILSETGRDWRIWKALLETSIDEEEASRLVGYLARSQPDEVKRMIESGKMPKCALIPHETLAAMLSAGEREDRIAAVRLLPKIKKTDMAVGPTPRRAKSVKR